MNFNRWGGRKQFNGYIYSLLVTGMAILREAAFNEYATWMAVALLGTSALVVTEDLKRKSQES